MLKEICDKVEEILKKKFGDGIEVRNEEYYIWVYSAKDDKMIMVVHGGSSEDNPLEVILTQIDRGKTVKKHFKTEKDLLDYFDNTFKKELVLYAL